MQTFVPSTNITECAFVLDRARLGKQRVETLQLVRCNLDITLGWKNHPAAKMWASNINGLIAYGVTMCDEWINRGYNDTCREKLLAMGCADETDMPEWWGDERVHASHRANLLRKNFDFYAKYGWTENPNDPYFWPTSDVVSGL